nr:hypothetical protein [Crocosphaera chwakensis]
MDKLGEPQHPPRAFFGLPVFGCSSRSLGIPPVLSNLSQWWIVDSERPIMTAKYLTVSATFVLRR